jgi:hypothetical protein
VLVLAVAPDAQLHAHLVRLERVEQSGQLAVVRVLGECVAYEEDK